MYTPTDELLSQTKKEVAQLLQRPRCKVGWFWPKVENWNWETVFYGHYRSCFSHLISLQSYRIRWKNAK